MKRGSFITFEGGEGAGKSSQIKILIERLQQEGITVQTTREPGGTPEAEKIRNLFAHRDDSRWTPAAECLLMFAARSVHTEHLIKPALAAGTTVICDRYADSTRAYQGYGHGMPLEDIEAVRHAAIGTFEPDLTLILDLDPQIGLTRSLRRLAQEGSGEDRFEHMDLAFHNRLRQGYIDIARDNPARCRVIDAAQQMHIVSDAIWQAVKAHLDAVR